MEFDLVELLQYLGLTGKDAFVSLLFVFILWIILSNDKLSKKMRIKIVKAFSNASSSIHLNQERLSEKINLDIDEILTTLQAQTNANNVLIVRFRNGTYDSMGNSILKFFASNEKTMPGYLKIGDNIQNISRTLYSEFCDTLIKEHKVYIKDTSTLTEKDTELLSLLKLFNAPETFYAKSLITTSDQQIIGFVCLSYIEKNKMPEYKIDDYLTDACARIVSKIEMGKMEIKKIK